MKQEFEKLLQQEMSRKEFLQYVGSALLLVVGFGAILKAFKIGPQEASRGYGLSNYGGVKQR